MGADVTFRPSFRPDPVAATEAQDEALDGLDRQHAEQVVARAKADGSTSRRMTAARLWAARQDLYPDTLPDADVYPDNSDESPDPVPGTVAEATEPALTKGRSVLASVADDEADDLAQANSVVADLEQRFEKVVADLEAHFAAPGEVDVQHGLSLAADRGYLEAALAGARINRDQVAEAFRAEVQTIVIGAVDHLDDGAADATTKAADHLEQALSILADYVDSRNAKVLELVAELQRADAPKIVQRPLDRASGTRSADIGQPAGGCGWSASGVQVGHRLVGVADPRSAATAWLAAIVNGDPHPEVEGLTARLAVPGARLTYADFNAVSNGPR